MEQKFIDLFDRFTHGAMTRRDFMENLRNTAGGAAAATAVLSVLENNYAHAAIIPEDDARIRAERATMGVPGYLATPADLPGKPGSVIIIHENRGLNPHIMDVARRMAVEGFVAFAPDYLHGLGGTPADADKARDMIGSLAPDGILADSQKTLAALQVNGKVGAVGFCWGGGQVNALAVADPALAAGVAYYGRQAPAPQVPKITAPLMLHYASLDERINAGIPEFEVALKAYNKIYELHLYEGANHAFNNDTNEARYNKQAADLAWGRTVGFLKKYLG